MEKYLNPFTNKNDKYIYTIKVVNKDCFSIFKDSIPTGFIAPTNEFYYIPKNMDTSIETIEKNINKITSYRKDVFLRLKEDKETINYFIDKLFLEENNKIKIAEQKQIKRYLDKIEDLKKRIEKIKNDGMIDEINHSIYNRNFIKEKKEKILKNLKF